MYEINLKLKNYFLFTEEENDILKNEIAQSNARRIVYASAIGWAITIVNLLLIVFGSHPKNELEEIWKRGVVYSNSFLLFLLSIVLYFSYGRFGENTKIIDNTEYKILRRIMGVIFFTLSIMGPIFSTIDQYVTTAITPFVVTSILLSFIYIIPPRVFYFYLIFSFAFFYFIIPITQRNPDVLLSNRVNMVSITGISIIIASILWRKNLKLFKSQRIIKEQKVELENQYIKTLEYSKKLKESNETKDRLFSIISHDLRGPIGNMSEAIEFILRTLGEDKETMIKMLHLLKESSVSSFVLLDNLLHWSRSQRGELSYKPSINKLQYIVTEVVKIHQLAASKKNIEIQNQVNMDLTAYFDKNMIHTVVRNLVSNAVKFSLPGGRIILQTHPTPKDIVFTIEDSGIGMEEDMIQKILFSNEIHSSFGTNSEKGHGLGLILCKDLLLRHGTDLKIDSKIGIGTKFSFRLPLQEQREPSIT